MIKETRKFISRTKRLNLQKILKRYEVLAYHQNTNPLTAADSMLITCRSNQWRARFST